MDAIWSRRKWLAAISASRITARAADKNDVAASEARRFRDGATEFEFLGLTNPKLGSAWLPAPPLRATTNRSNTLVYASDRSGTIQAWRMDLKNFQSRLLTSAENMDAHSLSLTANDKSLVYFDRDRLVQTTGSKARTLYTTEAEWEHIPGMAVADDSTSAAFLERRQKRYRMRVIALGRGNVNTLLESEEPVQYMRLQPKRPGLLYNYNGVLTVVNLNGGGAQRLRIAEGTAGDAQWSADGRRVHYLLTPAAHRKAVELREHLIDTGEDKLIGATTQFVSLARNSDSSVFAGVSGSKAAPYLLLLLRAAHRELTIVEHRATDPSKAVVLFSLDSQSVFWQTDREGRSAIYKIDLERFIEKTLEETQ